MCVRVCVRQTQTLARARALVHVCGKWVLRVFSIVLRSGSVAFMRPRVHAISVDNGRRTRTALHVHTCTRERPNNRTRERR